MTRSRTKRTKNRTPEVVGSLSRTTLVVVALLLYGSALPPVAPAETTSKKTTSKNESPKSASQSKGSKARPPEAWADPRLEVVSAELPNPPIDEASSETTATTTTMPGAESPISSSSEEASSSSSSSSTINPGDIYQLFWQHDELPRRLRDAVRLWGSHLARIAQHQPPVGIVFLILFCRVGNNARLLAQQVLAEWDDAGADTNGGGTTASASASSITSSDYSQRGSAPSQHRSYRPRRNRWGSTAWCLDRGDTAYPTHGGVQPNRILLCLTVLQRQIMADEARRSPMQDGASGERNNTSESLALQETRRRLVQAMSVGAQALVSSSKSSSASSPLVEFCQQLAVPLSHISDSPSFSAGAPRRSPAAEATTATSAEELAYWTCQVRMHDALLRVVRNRLLQSTVRLARTSQHWKRRRRIASSVSSVVAGAPSSTPWLQPSARKSASQSTGGGGGGILSWWNRNVVQRRSQWALEVDHDQKTRWAVAQASYMAEAAKLGRVTSVLIQQPDDLDPSHLIVASEQEVTAPTSSADDDRGRDTSKLNETPAAAPPARGAAQWLPRYSMRWVADGKGHVSIRKLDPNPMAWWEDSSGDQGHGNKDHRRWGRFAATLQGQVDAVRHAKAWVHEARAVISQVVQETIETSVRDPKRNKDGDDDDRDQFNNNSTERQRLLDSWCSSEAVGRNDSALRQDPEQVEQVWNRIITYCDTLSSWRRPGEGQVVRWWDMAVVGWTRRLDFLGIPTSFLYYRLAQLVHSKIGPYLPSLRADLSELVQTLWSIVQQRVLFPVRQIVLDILNQNKGMMSAFSLNEEQLSLDRMLRDLDLADGSPEQRRLGLQHATEQYEQILQRGLLSNLIRGRLVRLMLIQVQQLKVGLLSALDTIDVLMQGNRIHFYALATIPSILLAYYSFRFFVRFLYSVRAKDPRPVSSAHADMTAYLDAMEGIFLKSDGTTGMLRRGDRQGPTPFGKNDAMQRRLKLSPLEVGELLLHVHRYLLLLDFGSPPFPISDCLYIHEGLQELFHHPGLYSHGDVSVDVIHDHHLLSWLGAIRRKHRGLLESSY